MADFLYFFIKIVLKLFYFINNGNKDIRFNWI